MTRLNPTSGERPRNGGAAPGGGERKAFVFYTNWYDDVATSLTEEQQQEFLLLIVRYASHGEEPSERATPIVRSMFGLIRNVIDADLKKWEKIRATNQKRAAASAEKRRRKAAAKEAPLNFDSQDLTTDQPLHITHNTQLITQDSPLIEEREGEGEPVAVPSDDDDKVSSATTSSATIAALPPEQQLPWMLRTVRNKLTSIHRHTRFVNDTLRYDDDDDDDNDDDALRYDDDDDDGSGHCSPQFSAGHYDSAGHYEPSPSSTPPLTIDREDYPRTYDALMGLSALQRRALLLTAEGWTPADIIAELQLPAATVYTMLSRARKAVGDAVTFRQQKYREKCL